MTTEKEVVAACVYRYGHHAYAVQNNDDTECDTDGYQNVAFA